MAVGAGAVVPDEDELSPFETKAATTTAPPMIAHSGTAEDELPSVTTTGVSSTTGSLRPPAKAEVDDRTSAETRAKEEIFFIARTPVGYTILPSI